MIPSEHELGEGQPPREVVRALKLPTRSETILRELRRPLLEAGVSSAEPLRRWRRHDITTEAHRFLGRSLRYLAACGIHQVVAVVAGDASHRIVRAAVHQGDPTARVAMLHTDAMVLATRRALLGECAAGGTPKVEPDRLTAEQLARVVERDEVDLTRPAALLLIGVLHHVAGDRAAGDLVDRLAAPLARGSALVVSHLGADHPSAGLRAAVRAYQSAGMPVRLRSRAEVDRLLTGLDLAAPGVELVSRWRRDLRDAVAPPAQQVPCWGAVGRVR